MGLDLVLDLSQSSLFQIFKLLYRPSAVYLDLLDVCILGAQTFNIGKLPFHLTCWL